MSKINNIDIEWDEYNRPHVNIYSDKELSKRAAKRIHDEFRHWAYYPATKLNKENLLHNLKNALMYRGKYLYKLPDNYDFECDIIFEEDI